MLDFSGRVAIVTGAGRGVGREHALMLGSRGCRVVVNDLPEKDGGNAGPAHQVVKEIIAAGGTAVADENSIIGGADKVVGTAIEAFGQLDIVINNAGTTDNGWFEDMSLERWRKQVDLHLLSYVDMCRAALPHLKASGAGRIINTYSGATCGIILHSNYAAAKSGLIGFSRCLALEVEKHGIQVNCIGPNARTRMQDPLDERILPTLEKYFPPVHIAAFVTWLAHQDTRVHNEIFEVGGGVVARMTFAHYPFVHADEATPEAWTKKAAEVVSSEGDLATVSSTLEMGMHEFKEVIPGFSMDDLDSLI